MASGGSGSESEPTGRRMPPAVDPVELQRARDVANAIRKWNGSVQDAQELRRAASSLRLIGKPESPDLATLAAIASAYGKAKNAGSSDRSHSKDARIKEKLDMWAPFIGDPALGAWPFHDSLHISDDDAVWWLDVVGDAAIDEQVRDFVLTMICVRRREVWIPAANAAAKLSMRDEAAANAVRDAWTEVFPDGLPDKWKPQVQTNATWTSRIARSLNSGAHQRRHVLYYAACRSALGGNPADLPGYSDETVCRMSLPPDPAEASVLLLAVGRLLDGERSRPFALAHAVERARQARGEPQCDRALRDIAERLRRLGPAGAEPVAEVERLLTERRPPVGSSLKDHADALWGWVKTAKWSKGRPNAGDLKQKMRASAGSGATALEIVLGDFRFDPSDPAAAVVERLPAILDRSVRLTVPAAKSAITLVELLLLLDDPQIKDLDWPSLLARAGITSNPSLPGEAHTVGPIALLLAFAEADGENEEIPPAVLLRDRKLDKANVLRLAISWKGFVGTQMAVQTERILRELRAPDEQVKFLWQILRKDPRPKFFEELEKITRGFDRPLDRFVNTLCTLAELRRNAGPKDGDKGPAQRFLETVRTAYDHCSEMVDESPSCGSAPGGAKEALKALREALGKLDEAGRLEAKDQKWCDAVCLAFTGSSDGNRDGGLSRWMKWHGGNVDTLLQTLDRVQRAWNAVAPERAPATVQDCDELDAALTEHSNNLQELAWPERDALDRELGKAFYLAESRRKAAKVARAKSERLAILMDRGDEEKVLESIGLGRKTSSDGKPPDEDRVAGLAAETVHMVNEFLLQRLLLRQSRELRKRVRARMALPAVWVRFTPLLGGIAGGPLLVLSSEALADVKDPVRLGIMLGAAFVASFVLMSGDLASRLSTTAGFGVHLTTTVVKRVLPLFAVATAIAFAMSTLTVWVLSRPMVPERLALWTALSLFLGIFVNVVIQGKSMTRHEPRG
jgi:hypothetical protein